MIKHQGNLFTSAEQPAAGNTISRRLERGPDLLRRGIVASLICGAVVAPFSARLLAAPGARRIEVWASPSCGCCKEWAKYLQEHDFEVEMRYEGNSDARTRLGVPAQYGSCHTGEIDGYAVEGHVPAPDIMRLLDEKPDAAGLAVPAMPRGSPGMDGPAYSGTVDPYDVLLIAHDGDAKVWQSYR